MTHDELMQVAESLTNDVKIVLDQKGLDYAPEHDALHEFRTTADSLGLRPEQVWAVHFQKQAKAVLRYCKDGKLDSEGIYSRLADVMAYAILLTAIIDERTLKS
jgi:hypothetical protein